MPDYSLDIAVAQAVEPMPLPPETRALDYVLWSPLEMWFWGQTVWNAGTFQDSTSQAMRAYELYFLRTGWRLIQLRHRKAEQWEVYILCTRNEGLNAGVTTYGEGRTAAIAICEAIKAASLADAEVPKKDAVPSAIL